MCSWKWIKEWLEGREENPERVGVLGAKVGSCLKNRSLALLIIREIQIKTTVSYHLTPVRRTHQKDETTRVGEGVEEREPL